MLLVASSWYESGSPAGNEVFRSCMALVRHMSVAECDDRRNGVVVEAELSHLPVRYQVEWYWDLDARVVLGVENVHARSTLLQLPSSCATSE